MEPVAEEKQRVITRGVEILRRAYDGRAGWC